MYSELSLRVFDQWNRFVFPLGLHWVTAKIWSKHPLNKIKDILKILNYLYILVENVF